MIKGRKTKTMATKRRKAKREINLSNKKEYKNDTGNNLD